MKTASYPVCQVDTGRRLTAPRVGDRHIGSSSSASTSSASTSSSSANQMLDYSSELNRVQSFDNWPADAPITADQLLQAGFHYTGEGQQVACHQCRVRHGAWQRGQNPVNVHSRTCPWLLERQQSPPEVSANVVAPTTMSSQQPPPPPPPATPTAEDAEMVACPVSYQSDSEALRRHARRVVPEFQKVWPNLPPVAFMCAAERLRTFVDWPVSFVSANQLASAGFVYLRDGDRVQCVFCNGEVMAWEQGDVPEQEHRRHFPACDWVRGVSADVRMGSRPPTSVRSAPPRPRLGYDECGPTLQHETSVVIPSVMTYHGSPVTLSSDLQQQQQQAGNIYQKQLSTEQLEDLNVVPHTQAMYPKFATREARLKSYQSWPADVPQSVASLVEAGLFYVGSTDQVKCFQCGGGLQNWESQDVPWEEHARWFPRCNFVNLNKGRDYVEKSKQHRPPVLPTPTEKSDVTPIQLLNTSISASHQVTESELDVLMNTDITRTVLDMGLEKGVVREVLRRRMQQCGYQFTNSEMLANAVLEVGDQITSKMENETQPRQVAPPRDEHTVLNMETVQASTSTAPSLNNTLGVCSEKVARTSEQELKLCKICMDEEINVVFLPCGHLVACTNCASAMTDCPLCRMPIKGTVRTYLP